MNFFSGMNGRWQRGLRTVAAYVLLLAPAFAAQAADDRIEQIQSRGELRVCWADDNPYSFKDPATNTWKGYNRDLAADFAAALGVKLVDVDSTFKTIISSVKNNECDIGGAALFNTMKRAMVTLFTDPIAYETTSAFVRSDSPYKTYADLDQPGKVIISKAGAASAEYEQRFFKKATVKLVTTDNGSVLAAEIANGRADAWWVSYTSTMRMLQQNTQFPVRAVGEAPVDRTGIVWAVNLGEYHFQQILNVWLAQEFNAGKTAELWKKWFGTDYQH